jgi:hypothetical protein
MRPGRHAVGVAHCRRPCCIARRALDLGKEKQMTVLPQIENNGYALVSVATFLAQAPTEHVLRYQRDCRGNGSFIIWDPNDDADGFMVCGHSIAQLNAEFLNHFDGFLAEQTNFV